MAKKLQYDDDDDETEKNFAMVAGRATRLALCCGVGMVGIGKSKEVALLIQKNIPIRRQHVFVDD